MPNNWIFRKLTNCLHQINAATNAGDHIFPKCQIYEKKVFPAVADAIILVKNIVVNKTLMTVALGVSDVPTSAE